MVRIVRTKVRAEVPDLSDASVQAIGQRIYFLAEEATSELVQLREKGVEVDVREGSLEIVAIVLTTAGSLYVALTLYDGFWSGVERIRTQARQLGEILGRRSADETGSVGGSTLSTNISLGHLDKLHRVHRDLEAGRIDAETAAGDIVRTLRTAGDPVTAEMISEIERAVGAKHRGLARLADAAVAVEKGVARTAEGGAGRIMPRPVKERRRRFTIRRRPGEIVPSTKFDT